jgi:hypothetical protein
LRGFGFKNRPQQEKERLSLRRSLGSYDSSLGGYGNEKSLNGNRPPDGITGGGGGGGTEAAKMSRSLSSSLVVLIEWFEQPLSM